MTAYLGKYRKFVDYLERNRYRDLLIWLAVIVLAFNAGCAAVQNGSPYAAQPGYVEPVRWTAVVMDGMRQTLLENSRALIMFNPNNQMVLFAWPRSGGWAWTVLDSTFRSAANALHQAGGAGNLMSCSDFSCLIGGAERIGYRQIDPGDLLKVAPGMITSILETAASTAASTLPNIVLIPVMPGMFSMPGAPVESVQ